jgi:hypothetical protein
VFDTGGWPVLVIGDINSQPIGSKRNRRRMAGGVA